MEGKKSSANPQKIVAGLEPDVSLWIFRIPMNFYNPSTNAQLLENPLIHMLQKC